MTFDPITIGSGLMPCLSHWQATRRTFLREREGREDTCVVEGDKQTQIDGVKAEHVNGGEKDYPLAPQK